MVRFKELTKKLVEVTACPRQRFDLREEDVKSARDEIKKRESPVALPREDFLEMVGRPKDDKTADHSISYCINMLLRDPDRPYRQYGIQVGVHTERGKKMFTLKPIDWDDWDLEHSYTEEKLEEVKVPEVKK